MPEGDPKVTESKTRMKNTPKPISKKTRVAVVKLTPEQYELIEQRASECGVRVGHWMRSILMQVANRPAKGYLKIREPNGALS